MAEFGPMLLFLVGIVLVVAMIVGGYLLERKRREKLMQVAMAARLDVRRRGLEPGPSLAGRAVRSR